MRHGKKNNHLGRTAAHRKAMLANMACSLIEHKRINTTVAKAKELRKYVEPLITKSKDDTTHNRRVIFSYLKSKHAVTELFREVAGKVAERPGGYTRIIKTGNRLGDNAEMCLIELVDFNELYTGSKEKKTASRRSRRGTGKPKVEGTAPAAAAPAAVVSAPEAPAAEVETAVETAAEAVAETTAEGMPEEVQEAAAEAPEASTETPEEDGSEEKANA
ncbi:50S ribosomal protein L17 [bacterium]|nr:50S ribosomal protein L17 [bacterium]